MKKNYNEAPFAKFHLVLYICIVLGQIACGYALGIVHSASNVGQFCGAKRP